jgi:hypothetical protein
MVWVGGVPYYYADDVYYVQRPDGYEVVAPPDESSVSTTPPSSAPPQAGPARSPGAFDVYVYPKNYQSPDQQTRDQDECHHWATTQTGFDPTQPPPDLPPGQLGQKRSDYRRAITACLEARGYTVQ